jgi:hypothetical protein
MIAAGGALGGLFVAVIAPLVFTDYFELHWGLLLCGVLFLVVCLKTPRASSLAPRPSSLARRRRLVAALGAAGLVALGAGLWLPARRDSNLRVCRTRNFYGVLTVLKLRQGGLDYYKLVHGRTAHGLQLADPQRASWPTLYYSERSGVGLALRALPAGPRRIGVVGLGTGTLAAYGRPGDYLRMYEINPEVERLARSWFTFLANCRGTVEVVPGDARLSLEREPGQRFDLLVLDAFNGDAVPVHLLTREAFAVYERHLATNGLIAVHVSNVSLNLGLVVANLARCCHYNLAAIDNPGTADAWWIYSSEWMLLSRNEQIINSPAIRAAATPAEARAPSVPLWTDDFASLFQIVRWRRGPKVEPGSGASQTEVAEGLFRGGDFAGAIARYRLALRANPGLVPALNNLAWILATSPEAALRDGPEAVRLAEGACRLTHYKQTIMVGTLAAAYAEADRFPEAVTTAEMACALAAQNGEPALLEKNQHLLELYSAGQPCHEAAPQ